MTISVGTDAIAAKRLMDASSDSGRSRSPAANCFPDQWYSSGNLRRLLVLAIPFLYLASALLHSASIPPWGRQVDPESAYAMNGLIAAAGYPSMMFAHPGTTTTLLVEIIIRLWALVVRPEDIVAFGFKNYDTIIYAARACEAMTLTGVLLASGVIVGNATRSVVAAVLFQVAPFVHPDTFHFTTVLIPESLMVSAAILSMALLVKSALDPNPPTVRLGVASGLIFAFGFSSKYLFFPLLVFGVNLLTNMRAFMVAGITGTIAFAAFNLILNPGAITRGFGWLFTIATHKGAYGHGEAGFIDFSVFWSNMAGIIAAAPLISGLYIVAALLSLAQMLRTRSHSDPVSRALLLAFVVFAAQLVATSKHFSLHYMMASWVLAGGVLVLTIVQTRRMAPAIPGGVLAATAAAMCAILVSTTLADARREVAETFALDKVGARLSRAVIEAGPACANVASMNVRAPENQISFGWETTMSAWGDQPMKDRFSASYARAFEIPLLDQSDYSPVLARNFRPHTYAKLAAEYPCIIVRTQKELNGGNSSGLLELNPDHCVVGQIHVYAVGISCMKIQRAFSGA
jgi:hypothetical protein